MRRNALQRTATLATFLATLLCGWIDADAKPFEAIVHEATQNKLAITITLRDPIGGGVLGTYEAVSGGFGRGSIPFGRYEIGRFRSDGPIGTRWMLRQVGQADEGDAYDVRIDSLRTALELHAKHGSGLPGTLGCVAVYGDWDRFRANLEYILAQQSVRFDLHPSSRPLMLFLHGMQSRYGEHKVVDVEGSARAYAEAMGFDLEVLRVSGDNAAKQERLARQRLAQGDVAAVYGFSAGAYTAERLAKDFPQLTYIKLGAPGTAGNVEMSGVDHMDLPAAMAWRAATWIDRA